MNTRINNKDVSIISYGPLFIIIWKGITKPEYIQKIREELEYVYANNPQGFFLLVDVKESAKIPSINTGKLLGQEIFKQKDKIKCSATFIHGNGVRSKVIKTFLNWITLFSEYDNPFKVFSKVEDLTPWIIQKLDETKLKNGIDYDKLKDILL